ncbi:MAG TPA: ornithine cyclodeaminase family protein [Candidatus Scatomorpha gallistercoris]|nr:ornithine cyclodeaminase family protein [Candidatus Scatomorpha gallistercoris]
MSEIRIISAAEVEQLFTVKMALEAVEKAYTAKEGGSGSVWPMVFHDFETGVADLDIKSGDLDGVFGLKLVSWFGENPSRGLPELYGTLLLCARESGAPLALMNAGGITGLRTGAAAAVGAKYLARPDSKRLLMVGCGAQSPYLVAATLCAMPGIESVVLANPHNPSKAVKKLPAMREKVTALLAGSGAERSFEFTATDSLEAAVREADIILTATPAREPMIKAEWVQPGTHLSCIGADISGKQEIDSAVFAAARAFGDDRAQCFAVGECEIPHRDGILTGLTEIGAVMLGKAPGRLMFDDVTVFDSTGIALQDLASAAVILERAKALGVGTVVTL